jgi:hypothetical protein
MRKNNSRLIQAVEKAGSVRALALSIEESPRTIQYQVRRGWLSPAVAKKVGKLYLWPRVYIVDLASAV